MRCTGFVLAGGQSRRMGTDKALLPLDEGVLLDRQRSILRQVAEEVLVIGAPHGLSDKLPGIGPLGGILTALETTRTDWNLIVACDLPAVTPDLLLGILDAAGKSDSLVVIPRTADGREHLLCGAYHRHALADLRAAADGGVRAVRQAIRLTRHEFLDYPDPAPFRNVNTPEEWAKFLEITHAT